LFDDGDRTYIFFEEFSYERGRGHLAVAKIDEAGDLGEVVPCFTPEFHVSYPCVFEHDGRYYMLPETAARGHIALYQAVDFPQKWTLCKVLVPDILAVDPTIYHDGRAWWLFAGVFEPGASADDELFVWYAESLLGEWTPHPRNPVVSDVRCARPAGLLFSKGSVLIRPAQDASRGYGSGMTLRRISMLTPNDYEEETIGHIDADWLPGAHATHTLNKTSAFDVTDGEGRRLRLARAQWRTNN
jgi:hypothetical protein